MLTESDFLFEELEETTMKTNYTRDCSGSRSDCCTRVCTRNNMLATEEEWGKFLEVNAGMIQY